MPAADARADEAPNVAHGQALDQPERGAQRVADGRAQRDAERGAVDFAHGRAERVAHGVADARAVVLANGCPNDQTSNAVSLAESVAARLVFYSLSNYSFAR